MARALGVVALLLAVAVAAAAASACSATAVPTCTPGEKLCDPRLVAERALSSCTPAFATRRRTCCDALLSAVPRGGAAVRCICSAAQEEELRFAGVTTVDMLSLYDDCGGALPLHPSEAETLCQDDAGWRRRLGAAEKCDATVVAWNISTGCSTAVGSEGAEIPHPCCEVIRLAGDIPECLCDAAQDPAVLESPISLEELRRMYKICGGMRRIHRCWPLEPASFTLPADPVHTHAPEQTHPLQPEQSRPVPLQPLHSPRTTTAPMPPQPSYASLWRTFWDGIGRKIVECVGFFLLGVASLALSWMAENWCINKFARGRLDVEKEREAEAARVREREEEAEAVREREREAEAAREREREAEAVRKKERRAARKAARARRAARKAAKMMLELELVQQKMLHAQKVFGESAASSSSSADTSTASSSSSPASTEYSSC